MSVAPTVFQYSVIGLCGMGGGISSVDCSASFHGVAMGAGSDFIYENGPLADNGHTRRLVSGQVCGQGSLSESLSLFAPIVLKG